MAEISSSKLSIDTRLLPATGRVLDVGCGDGRHLRAAAERGCTAIGIDYDAGALRDARARGGELQYVVADASRLPFRADVFDAAICTETLEHLPDDAGAMHEIARVLRPGARVLGAVPSHFTERVYWRLSRGYWDTPGGHVRIYAPRRLFGKLAAAGLRVESMRYLHFVDSLFWLRFCLVDFVRNDGTRTEFEQAVAIAAAQERSDVVPSWRRRLRTAFGRSRLIVAIDAAGAYIWPKSLAFVARKDDRADR